MKPRRVIISLELNTGVPIKDLKAALMNMFKGVKFPMSNITGYLDLIQVQSNVIKK